MSHIFISYNQEDADFAGLLMMRLEKAGFETWMDKSRLRAGSDWSQEIDRGISEAFALVVIMSPSAKASEYVTYEWSFALGVGIPVISVVRKQTDLHPRLNRLQYLNFKNDQPWEKLVDELTEIQKNCAPALQIPRNTPPYIRHAIAALDSANKEDRRGGIDSLAETDHLLAGEALLKCLEHPLRDVRFGAALILGKRGDVKAIPVLLNSLPRELADAHSETDPNQETFEALILAFLALGSPGVEALIEAFNSGDLKYFATIVFGEISAYQAVPPLASVLKSVELDDVIPWFYDMIVKALSQIGSDAAIEAIIGAWHKVTLGEELKDYHIYRFVHVYRFVHALTEAVVNIDSLRFAPTLIEAMESDTPLVRGLALLAVEQLVHSVVSGMALDEVDESAELDELASEELISALADLLGDHTEVETFWSFSESERPHGRTKKDTNGREELCNIARAVLGDINTPQAHNALMRF